MKQHFNTNNTLPRRDAAEGVETRFSTVAQSDTSEVTPVAQVDVVGCSPTTTLGLSQLSRAEATPPK